MTDKKLNPQKPKMTIFVANPHGLCAGVVRAIEMADGALKKYGAPLYVNHEIVHNKHVVADFEKKGAVFVKNISDVPDGSVVLLSAHGSPKKTFAIAAQKNLTVVDAACPLVLKVHRIAQQYEKEEKEIVIIGHASHVEVEGTSGQLRNSVKVIENEDDAMAFEPKDADNLSYVTQTTLSADEVKSIISILHKRFPNITGRGGDICYATQNRQDAIKAIIEKIDILLVVGSVTSSNSNRLCELAKKHGKAAYLIDSEKDINREWLDENAKNGAVNVGVSSGASAPEYILEEVLKVLGDEYNADVINVEGIKESIVFHAPKSVRLA